MLLDYISFSYNWNNKLDCRAFTTIRLYNPNKYILHANYRIELQGNEKCIGKIVAINRFKLEDLTETVAYIDTGYNKAECEGIIRKMYKDVNFSQQLLSLITIAKV
jgi:hypothetical protein